MGIGVSLILVAVGAILIWAVNATVSGIELHTIGWILLIVGAVGALLMGPDGAFITGSDVLIDGGVTASYFFGELAPQ